MIQVYQPIKDRLLYVTTAMVYLCFICYCFCFSAFILSYNLPFFFFWLDQSRTGRGENKSAIFETTIG